MRAFIRRAGASLLITASLSLAGVAAHADELLVMPYVCSMIGGRPELSPAPEQSHRVIGQREQRAFSACSPLNPDMCRNWTVHRFDLECEGARVPWVSVVAAAAEQTSRRAWVEDGRLLVRMPQSWSIAQDDACARGPGFDDRWGFGRMRRYCADRRAMAPPPVVEMPFGFAPMLGIDGFFVKSSGPSINAPPPLLPPPVAAAPPPPKVARAEPTQPPSAEPTPPARPEPPADPVAKDVPANAPTPPKVAIQPPPPSVVPPPPVQAAKPPPPVPPAPPAATSGGPVIPKIINRPDAATTDVAEQMPPATTAPKAAASAPPAPPKDVSRPEPAPSNANVEREGGSITVSLLSVVRSPAVSAIAAFGGLALVLLAAFALARRRERAVGARRPHDIASVSLDGRRGRGNLVPRPTTAAAAPPRRPATPPPPPASPALIQPVPHATPASWVERIPQTRAEAMQVLGMGVTPDANEMAMKKIVDGLRLSWHPDLAKDETDRQLREFRLKQINAAWELIQGKRLERLDS